MLVVGTRQLAQGELGKTFPDVYKGAGEVVVVRRPIMTDATGIQYKFFDFLSEELETSEQQSQRLYQKIIERQKLAMAEIPQPQFSKPS